jgi:polyisoprenoid-binding protein YceI
MKRAPCRAAVLAMLAGVLALARAAAQPVTPTPLGNGEVTFLVHSTFVGGIHGWAPVAHAEFTGDELGMVRGLVVVRVADMQTGNRTRDHHLRQAMEADSFPTIRFDLLGVEPAAAGPDTAAAGANAANVTLSGQLTIHGITRPVRAPATVTLRPGRADVVATFTLDMRDYGIKPPVRALVLRVAPEVVITVRLSFGSPASP